MSVWKKLVTAVKGGATEAAQSVVDSQAIRILEQEIREAKEELRKSDHARTQILAKCKLSQQKVCLPCVVFSGSFLCRFVAFEANTQGGQVDDGGWNR